MRELLQFFGVVFLVMHFWALVGRFLGKKSERPFRHWMDDSDDL
jgi:hypothetical protein